jgi:hypothetical protein
MQFWDGGRLLREAAGTLKSQHVRDGRALTLVVVPGGTPDPAKGDLLLYTVLREPERGVFVRQHTVVLPSRATLSDLEAVLRATYDLSPDTCIHIGRRNPFSNEWTDVSASVERGVALSKKPLRLKDGDIVCASAIDAEDKSDNYIVVENARLEASRAARWNRVGGATRRVPSPERTLRIHV